MFNSQLVVMATGTGKTTVFSEVIKQFPTTLVLAHRRELIQQAVTRIAEYTGQPVGIEMGARRSRGESIIVGSVQSVKGREIDPPDLLVIDEAHHAVSTTYRTIIERYPGVKLLGVTATPDRSDGLALGAVFKKVAYRYETPQAIKDGWLAPIFTQKVYGVSGLISAVGSRKTVVFTTNVAEAIEVAGLLPDATYIHGELSTTERDERLKGFRDGRYQFVTNCNILTEGWDFPSLGCVCMMRATQSRGLFMQALGRGLRLAPGKDDCLFLDMVDMPKHSLEGPRDALGGKEAPNFLPANSWWRKLFV